MKNRFMATAFVAATVLTAIAASANAHPDNRKSITQVDSYGKVTVVRPNPNDVWVGNELAGRDPDANVRLQLRRDFGNL